MKQYVYLEESPYKIGLHTICLKYDLLPITYFKGSGNILFARIMNLSYANYLRMCRDLYNGEIIGKNEKYPVVYFKNEPKELLKILNERINSILNK